MSTATQDALDRMIGIPSGAAFIAAATFEGAKKGYYFGTTSEKTGYYLDQNAPQSASPSKKRRKITINEDRNTVKEIPSAASLLKEAEDNVDPHAKILDFSSAKHVTAALGGLQKSANTNALQRASSGEGEGSEFMESELALYEQISAFRSLAASPQLYASLNELDVFTELLQHPNVDISMAVVGLFSELLAKDDDGQETDYQSDLSERMVQQDELVNLVVGNLGRTEEEQLWLTTLTLIQLWLDESSSALVAKILVKLQLPSWLLTHFDSGDGVKDRAADVLVSILQQEQIYAQVKDWTKLPPYSSTLVDDDDKKPAASKKTADTTVDGIEILLLSMALFRKKQPSSETETDFLENVVLSLSALLTYSSAATPFLEKQGLQLVLRCVKERVHAGGVGLSLLDLPSCAEANIQLVEQVSALKYLFPIFMGRSIPKPFTANKKEKRQWMQRLETTLVQMFYNLSVHLPEGDNRERFICKFLEHDKVDRLVELYLKYQERGRLAEYKYWRSVDEGDEVMALSEKLAGGTDVAYRCASLIGYLCVHSKRCHSRILEQLEMQQSGISVVKTALLEFSNELEAESQAVVLGYLEQI